MTEQDIGAGRQCWAGAAAGAAEDHDRRDSGSAARTGRLAAGAARSPRGLANRGLELMATGTVKWLNADKGFGFIALDDGTADVFATSPRSRAPATGRWMRTRRSNSTRPRGRRTAGGERPPTLTHNAPLGAARTNSRRETVGAPNGGYRVLTVTSNCDAALPLLKSVSELNAGSARRQDSLTWMKIARRSTSSVRDRHHRGGHDHRGDGGVAVRKPTGPYPDAPPAPRPEQPQRGRAAGPWGSNG